MIRLTIPSIEEDDLQAVREVISSGYLVQGKHVAAFEQAVAAYVGTRYAIAVGSCTAALHLALLALGVSPGDQVVVTSYSFVATANVIELCGAQPVFVDIQPDTFNMDPHCLESTLKRLLVGKNNKGRIKAILPVHTFGQLADMPAIMDISNRYHIPVVEDAACALGATLDGKQAGTWGRMGCFSFHPRKAITTGEGGIIVTDDPSLERKLRLLRNHGQDPDAPTIDFVMPGFNYRMTEFQAALGITQMAKLDRIISTRRERAGIYNDLLTNTPVQAPWVAPGNQHVYQSYVILLPRKTAERQVEIIHLLKEQGIETTIGTWHIPLTTYFRTRYGYQAGDFPVTDDIFVRSLSLPLFEKLSISQQDVVIHELKKYIGS